MRDDARVTNRYATHVTRVGIVIGGAYRPPRPAMTRTEERLQASLLEPRTAQPRTLLQMALGAFWRWL